MQRPNRFYEIGQPPSRRDFASRLSSGGNSDQVVASCIRYGISMIAGESARVETMELDNDKLDAAALAILSLTLHDDRRVWKGVDWEITDRLYEKGLIENPAGRAKSLVLTNEGLAEAETVLAGMFGKT